MSEELKHLTDDIFTMITYLFHLHEKSSYTCVELGRIVKIVTDCCHRFYF